MKIAHEAPLSIIDVIKCVTDYDYALVHLFDESKEYYNYFKNSIKQGRTVYLDNSVYELGKSFDADEFADWIKKLKPTAYVIPDVIDNYKETKKQFDDWLKKYNDLPGKKIGVVQGNNYEELCACYKYMNQHADIIAISFNHEYYFDLFPDSNKYVSMCIGRPHLLETMFESGIINTSKPHHLLGCSLPQEFVKYKDYPWIDSVDTSNPVVHGMANIEYDTYNDEIYHLNNKNSEKLFKLIDNGVSNSQLITIIENIRKFRINCLNNS